ncbi:hypothetical protein ACFV2U_19130 [Streptomyces sp. NPDC059697]|uniref:hypothetical protein n=1 Tax=Streptomyces sp. NPDC059697 TaxID=3346912 RepID=UPI00367B92DD
MGLLDKLTGTKYPDSGVVPLPTMELRAALLALNESDVPFRVRNAIPAEKADLVAECQIRLLRRGSSRYLAAPRRPHTTGLRHT